MMSNHQRKKVTVDKVKKRKANLSKPVKAGYKEVICAYITKNGKRIYPKGKAFRFIVKI